LILAYGMTRSPESSSPHMKTEMLHSSELYNHCRFSVAIPPGIVEAALRYRPWDAPLGVALYIVGVAISI
jgi:hypothetical protein